jgi:hypothetical protein
MQNLYQWQRVFIDDALWIDTNPEGANARVLRMDENWGVYIHWIDKYNTVWDFWTELMHFNSDGSHDVDDMNRRNAIRKQFTPFPVSA